MSCARHFAHKHLDIALDYQFLLIKIKINTLPIKFWILFGLDAL